MLNCCAEQGIGKVAILGMSWGDTPAGVYGRHEHGTAGDHGGSYTSLITEASAVSVCVSSLVRTAVDHSPLPAGELRAVPPDLLIVLEALIDPMAHRGVRHRLVSLLAVAVCAVLAGARSTSRSGSGPRTCR